MKIRLYNARILTMRDGEEVFEGEARILGDRIAYVGITDGRQGDGWDREIDCGGGLLMPGFKNAHTHSGMTIFRSMADDLALQEWLNDLIFPSEELLTPEDIYETTRLAVLEYLSGGVTAAFDMYLTPESIARAFSDCGMRCVLVGAVNNFVQSADYVEQMYRKLNGVDPLVSYRLGFHAEYTCGRELLERMAGLSRKYKAPVFTHLAETSREVEECKERYGMTPLAFLDSLGMFEYGGGGYHCIHMTSEDMDLMKKRGLYAVTNPGSNLKLASGAAPVAEFLRRGIPVAVGTDGPGSNNCLDMFREMFLVTGLAKLTEKDPAAVDAKEVLKMATVNGAHAMGLSDADTLSEGKLADLILLDMNKPNMRPVNNPAKNIVYSGSKDNVRLTMIGGRILYEDGQYRIGADPEEIYRRVERIADRIRRR